MDKIIVEIKCPASAKSYDFRISKKLSVSEGLKKIIAEIRGIEQNEKIFANDEVSLFMGNNNAILNTNMTFAENGIRSGDILMLI